jgi:hypothetical protein
VSIPNICIFDLTNFVHFCSALIFAANNGHLDLVKKLVDLKANIEDRANNWRTPLLCACLWGHLPVVEYLVNNGQFPKVILQSEFYSRCFPGANVTVFDADGMTAIMSATVNGHNEIVKYMLKKGADPIAKNFNNGTALSIAKIKNNHEVVTLLEPYFKAAYVEESPFLIAIDLVKSNVLWVTDLLIKYTTIIATELRDRGLPHYESLIRAFRPSAKSRPPPVYNYAANYHNVQRQQQKIKQQMKEANEVKKEEL